MNEFLYTAARVAMALAVFLVALAWVMLGWIQFQTWRNKRRYERMQDRLTLPYDQTGKDRLS